MTTIHEIPTVTFYYRLTAVTKYNRIIIHFSSYLQCFLWHREGNLVSIY